MEEVNNKDKPEALDFDAALEELEERVKRLEDGKLPLEEALECFKEGISLVRACSSKLKDAETVIQQLISDEDGSITETLLEMPQDGDFA